MVRKQWFQIILPPIGVCTRGPAGRLRRRPPSSFRAVPPPTGGPDQIAFVQSFGWFLNPNRICLGCGGGACHGSAPASIEAMAFPIAKVCRPRSARHDTTTPPTTPWQGVWLWAKYRKGGSAIGVETLNSPPTHHRSRPMLYVVGGSR